MFVLILRSITRTLVEKKNIMTKFDKKIAYFLVERRCSFFRRRQATAGNTSALAG